MAGVYMASLLDVCKIDNHLIIYCMLSLEECYELDPLLKKLPEEKVLEIRDLLYELGELAINGGAYLYDFYARFLQYDIDQSYNYVINTPQLTR